MAKFKIGDRVQMVGMESYVPYGEIGTVIEISITPDVEWDDYKSHRGGSLWAVSELYLKPIKQEFNYEIY